MIWNVGNRKHDYRAHLGFDFKTGARKDLANVLMADEVFKDANKGERQTGAALKKAFGTDNVEEIAKIIFRDGELQLTTDQRRKMLEEKKAKVIALIAMSFLKAIPNFYLKN